MELLLDLESEQDVSADHRSELLLRILTLICESNRHKVTHKGRENKLVYSE